MEALFEIIGCPVGSFRYSALMRLIFAVFCGGVIGLERGMKGRPAGIKTFSLVCVGATLAMVTNEYISVYIAGGSGDAARMAAQVISGIGFLGAGTIMVTGASQIKGLTTAAALWVTAAVGITIGAGFYFGAVATTVIVVISSAVFRMVDALILHHAPYMRLCVEGVNEEFMVRLMEFFAARGIHVKSLVRRSENKWYKKDICVILELQFKKRQSHQALLKEIEKIEGLRFAEEI